MDEANNVATGQMFNLKQLDQPALDNTKVDILKVDATITDQIENIVSVWLDNQQAKRLYNAVNSVLNPTQNSLAVDDFNVLIDLLTRTHDRFTAHDTSNQYDQSFDLSRYGLKHALFTLLKHRRRTPTFDEIIEDLEKFNFQSKAEHHRESVRTMLRYYCDKKRFLKIDENEKWALTAAGEKFFATESELLEAATDEAATQTTAATAPAAEMRDGTGKFSDKFDAGGLSLAAHYADIIRESGAEELHALKIAEGFNQKFNRDATAHDVGSTLRKNSHTKNPIVKALGDNVFALR